jgi:hypothetical protein
MPKCARKHNWRKVTDLVSKEFKVYCDICYMTAKCPQCESNLNAGTFKPKYGGGEYFECLECDILFTEEELREVGHA